MNQSAIRYYLNQPRYSTAEASRLVGLKAYTASRWLSGYCYKYRSEIREQKPVASARRGGERTTYASFLDLVDLLVVKEFRERGFSLPKIRKFLYEIERYFGAGHFARRQFFTDGERVFTNMSKQNKDLKLELLRGGQTISWPVIEKIADEIKFDDATSLALRWFPLGNDNLIVIDPFISFGRPIIKGKAVPTRIIYSLYVAEGRNLQAVREWHGLTRKEAQAAVEYEEKLAA